MRMWLFGALLLLFSCKGSVEYAEAPEGVGISGVRRLSADEYDRTIRDLLHDESSPARTALPADVIDPFDNDFTQQEPTAILVTGVEALANDVASRFVADSARRSLVVGCTLPAPDDAVCLHKFIVEFGRRAIRRPLTLDEIDPLMALGTLFATSEGDFWEGIDVVLRVFLQHPEFIYRVEKGTRTAEEGVYRLDDFEVATRLSYFVWGTTPDDRLLDMAEAGLLRDSAMIGRIASEMLEDPRALERTDRFHAMWMGYWALPHDPDLTAAMRLETRRLLEEVIYIEQSSWLDVFTMNGTWIDDDLAGHYDLQPPGSDEPMWVRYDGTTRQGILSHGSFLSVAGKFGDTSPTQRGKLIRTRLMCQPVAPPPPDVNVDEPPEDPTSDCKFDAYASHRVVGTSCKDCHDALDPVGFGLENYDQAGVYREHDNDHPECTIAGDGDVDGATFNGPAGLADILIESETITDCVVQQMYRFAMGHEAQDIDRPLVTSLAQRFPASGYRFDQLMLDLITDPTFQYRREETP